jgi:hypothetical protein
MRRSYLAAALAAAALAVVPLSAARANEAYVEHASGEPVALAGYGSGAAEIYTSPTLTLDVNRAMFGLLGWKTYDVASPEMRSLVRELTLAVGLWNNVPGSRLRLAVGQLRDIRLPESASQRPDGMNLVTLVMGGGIGGAAHPKLGRDSGGTPCIVEADFHVNVDLLDDPLWKFVTPHELGHAVGFTHSSLWTRLLKATGATSAPSVMSYDAGWNGVLAPDDIATAARMYPDSFNRISRTTGTVRGRALRSRGRPLYGAIAVLIDRTSGAAVGFRHTGYATSTPARLPQTDGLLEIDGVAPGTYDLLVVNAQDRSLISGAFNRWDALGSLELDDVTGVTRWQRGDGGLNPATFRPAWLRGLRVAAGETLDLPDVTAGTDRSLARAVSARGDRRVELNWSRAFKAVGSRQAEALDYFVEVRAAAGGAPLLDLRVHGDALVTHLPRGAYDYRVRARWNTDEAPFVQRAWTPFSVR